jgi:hypothetical protein
MLVVEFTGAEIQVVVDMGGYAVTTVCGERHDFAPGDQIRLRPLPNLVPCPRSTGTRL